jgi:ABC-type transport system involved in cytochrome bd biosynthesis fused ATPase/permease subunit
MIHISFQISEKEFKRALLALWSSNRIWIYVVIASVLLLVNFSMAILEEQYKMAILSWMLPLVIICVLTIGIYWFNSSRAYKQTAFSKGELNYTFNEEGIQYDVPDSNGNLKWSAITKVKESKEFFYLYTTKVTAIIIPKRAFKIEDDLTVFKNLLVSRNFLKR